MTGGTALLLVASFIAIAVAVPCEFGEGNYQLQWGLSGQTVYFRMIITGVPQHTNGWTAVGFGSSMISGLDVIVVRLLNGRVIVTDEYVRGFSSPFPDRNSNVFVSSVEFNNGVAVIKFSRPAVSTEYPYDKNLQGCQPWKFAVGLNRMSPNGDLFHHIRTPVTRMVCLDQCRI